MSELQEIVGQDVNLESEQSAPETESVEQGNQEVTPAPEKQEPAEEQQPDSRTVPLAALHEERQRRKELQQELARDREERARRDAILEQRLAALTQQFQPQPPAFEENPAEHLRHGQQQLQQTVQQIAEANRIQQEQQAQQQAIQRLAGIAAQHEQAFVQQAPDYGDAVTFLRNQRVAELMADGAQQHEAVDMAAKEFLHLALTRAQQGQNPAEVAYKLAKARGYTSKPAAPSAAEKIASQQKGVAAARTLGSGGPANNGPTLEALASMSDEEFAEATKGNNWAKRWGA